MAGATRGAGRGIAVELGAAGAHVYVTGRTHPEPAAPSTAGPETIEETAELVTAAGGRATAVAVDHLEPDAGPRDLVARIERESGRLDVLVNDIWGGERLFDWTATLWEHDLDDGLRLLRLAVETHLITSHYALPLLIRRPGGLVVEMTDGTAEYNAANFRVSAFYDLAKSAVLRLAWSQGHELAPFGGTAVALTPGWMRSEMMLEHYGVTEDTWREVLERPVQPPFPDPGHFGISETPRFTGRAVAALAADPDVARWNQASLSSGQLAREYGFTDLDGSSPDAWRYIVEVQDAGQAGRHHRLPVSPHGRRRRASSSSTSTGRPRAMNQPAIRRTSRARNCGPCGFPTTSTTCGRSISTSRPSCHQQVVRRQVAVGQALAGQAEQRLGQLRQRPRSCPDRVAAGPAGVRRARPRRRRTPAAARCPTAAPGRAPPPRPTRAETARRTRRRTTGRTAGRDRTRCGVAMARISRDRRTRRPSR